MSKCRGTIPVTAKVDRSMRDFIDEEAERIGVSRAEVLRRVFDAYRDSHQGETVCHNCGEQIAFNVEDQ